MKPVYCTILGSFGGVLAAIGFTSPSLRFIGMLGAAFFFFGLASCIGAVAFPHERTWLRNTLGLLGSFALIAVFGGATYYVYALNTYSISGLMILLPWLPFIFSPFAKEVRGTSEQTMLLVSKAKPADAISVVLFLTVIGFDVIAARWLMGGSTAEAIRSPWEVVHPIFFLWVFLGTYSLVLLAYRTRMHHLTVIAMSLHLFMILSPALLVYQVGFGFDPFIHIATEKLIATAGSVEPKPLYYLGQYGIVTLLAKTLHLPVALLDRFLLPVLAAIFLPVTSVYLLRRGFNTKRHLAVLAALGLFLLPLSSFISTTPQGLSNLFSLLTFLIGIAWLTQHRPPLPFILLLAGASLAIHPLSGIPALLFVAFLIFFKLREWKHLGGKAVKASVYLALFAAAAVAIPLLFAVNAQLQHIAGFLAETSGNFREALRSLPIEAPAVESRFHPALDFTELLSGNAAYILLLIAAGGAFLLSRKKVYRRTVWVIGTLTIALLANVIFLNTGITHANVIEYEQANYGDRLFELALLLIAPLVLAAVAWWWQRLERTGIGIRLFSALFFSAFVAASTFAAFPRNDAFEKSRGLSVSEHDIKAVRHINTNGRAPYIVLANQSVSVAALQEFGFKTYYGDQFYYPIPTGAPLYGFYLDMVYGEPTRKTMEAAMRSVGVPTAFFVINDYWTGSEGIVEQAKQNADRWVSINDGKLHIFEYRL